MRVAASKAEIQVLFGGSWKSLRGAMTPLGGVSEVTEENVRLRVHFGAVFLQNGSMGEKGLTLMVPVLPIMEGSDWWIDKRQ